MNGPQRTDFRFVTAGRIEFGRGSFERIGSLIAGLGRRALVVTNAARSDRHGLIDRLRSLASAAAVETEAFEIAGEPDIEDVDRGLDAARGFGADAVVGIGGGSAIDAAKAIAGLLGNDGSCLDYMEVIGEGRPLLRPATPWIAVPTTAGTGAEVTRNAVIGSKEAAYKASIRSPHLLARIALVDPELGVGVRAEITARSGMDALTQCVESYTSRGANPLTDALALEGVSRASRSLRAAVARGDDLGAREDMALAALISGITLTNAGLGAVHGFAAPVGARFPVPHGVVCAALLPHVMRANVEALRDSEDGGAGLARYAAIGRILSGAWALRDGPAADAGISAAEALARDVGIPGLGSFGVTADHVEDIVAQARRASSMRFNPVELTDAALGDALRRAL